MRILHLIIFLLAKAAFAQVNVTKKPNASFISVKAGITKHFFNPEKIRTGYVFYNGDIVAPWPYPHLSFEYSFYTGKQKSVLLFTGLMFHMYGFNISYNPQNISFGTGAVQGHRGIALRPYIGNEIKIPNREFPNAKNFFSFFYGASFGIAPMKPIDMTFGDFGTATTISGEQIKFEGIYRQKALLPVTPALICGFRFHHVNKRGKEDFALEILGNYAINRYWNYVLKYTVNGVPAEDRLGEKGMHMQFNIRLPLKTFRGK
jgi:hypothetical protein